MCEGLQWLNYLNGQVWWCATLTGSQICYHNRQNQMEWSAQWAVHCFFNALGAVARSSPRFAEVAEVTQQRYSLSLSLRVSLCQRKRSRT